MASMFKVDTAFSEKYYGTYEGPPCDEKSEQSTEGITDDDLAELEELIRMSARDGLGLTTDACCLVD